MKRELLTVCAIALALFNVEAAIADQNAARNKFLIAFASAAQSQEACGYSVNDRRLIDLMNDAGLDRSNFENIAVYSPFAIAIMADNRASIAQDKKAWCSTVWTLLGPNGSIADVVSD